MTERTAGESVVAWRTNVRRRLLRARLRLCLLLSVGLLLAAITFDALPFDVDLPGIPDVELSLPLYATLSVAWILALAALYASWLLYANTPERIGFHREGIVVGYPCPRRRAAVARRLFSHAAPSEVRWKDVRRVVPSGPLQLSSHDLTLRTHRGRSWVLVGLSPELLRAIPQAFEVHVALATTGLWRGHAPIPFSDHTPSGTEAGRNPRS